MRFHARVWLVALLTGVLISLSASAVAQAAAEVPLVEKLVATNCKVSTCGQVEVEPGFFEPKPVITKEEAVAEGFTQAGGRVPFGITDFKVLTLPEFEGKKAEYSKGTVVPTLRVTHIRTDVAPGLATNPFAVERCSVAEFGKELVPSSHLFTAPGAACAKTEIGEQFATAYAGNPKEGGAGDLPLSGKVYDLIPGEGETMANKAKLASLYGVALALPTFLTGALLKAGFEKAEKAGAKPGVGGFPSLGEQAFLEAQQWYAHTLIKGNVEWGKDTLGTNEGDYHDYFEIEVSPELPLIRSRLVFTGTAGEGDFITNATSCPGHLTTTLKIRDLEGNEAPPKAFTTPIPLNGCESLLFQPSFAFGQETTTRDQPDVTTTEASEPHNPKANDESQVKTASFTLPEGMTLNPSAAHGLEACTPKQAHQEGTVFGPQFGVECPAGSKLGTVTLNVPTLPNGSLTGSVYLGGPESGPITGPPFTLYVVANSEQYGVSVRLIGEVIPNETTGQVTTVFRTPPEQPFSSLAIHFERGVLAAVANPLVCGAPTGSSSFVPTSAPGASVNASFGISVTGCASSIPPFAPTQSTSNQTSNAGGHTSYAFTLERPDGQQYVSQVSTTLPEGLVGAIPAVTQCGEPQAAQGTCSSASQIGTATVLAGSGPTPYSFSGPVYLTGPYNGAPFGLSIAVPAVAGPFNLGTVVTRATIKVDPYTARVTVASVLPRIVKGVPLRLKRITVNVEKQAFLFNPTNCSAKSTETTVTGFTPETGATATVTLTPSPFQVGNCNALAFKPSFKSATSSRTSKVNGASLETTINEVAGQANIKSVLVQLPAQLPSRLSTLNKACTTAVFAANPYNCGPAIGGARANTPTLPGKLSGPVYFVARGGAQFPDLDLVMEANGVRVILVGSTKITKGITTTFFAAPPDVPVSSITVNLPIGPRSALAGFGNFCTRPLYMPTTIEGQNGKIVKQNTQIRVNGCGVQIVGRKVIGKTIYLTVKTFAGGRISGGGSGLRTVYRRFGGAVRAATLKIPVGRGGRHVRVRVGFLPSKRSLGTSTAFTTVFVR
jgi:hypothetical protein